MEKYSCPVLPLGVSQLKLSTVEVYTDQIIGKGSFSHTYRARCDQLPCVAKTLQFSDATEEELLSLEIACQLLSAVRHPSIVQCLGTARWGCKNYPIILMEGMEENLTHFVGRHSTELSRMPYYVKVNILCDVAFGMAYLHFSDIIHGSLTANNILIIGESQAKVTDFWMSKMADTHPAMHSSIVEPSKKIYMPSEVRNQRPPSFTQQSDAYSVGVITVLVDTQKIPELDQQESITSEMEPASPFAKVANGCLESAPSDRPKLESICQDLMLLKSRNSYVTDRETSRGECGHLKHCLSAQESEMEECKMQLQRKDREIAGMKMEITGLEQAVLDIRKENKELAKKCAEHDKFARHLLQLSTAGSPTMDHYRAWLSTPPHPTDEPDSTMLSPPAHSDAEIHGYGDIIPSSDIHLEDSMLGQGESSVVLKGSWRRKNVAFKKYNITSVGEWLEYQVEILGKLSHPNVVKVYGAVVEAGYLGILLEEMKCSLCELAFGENQFHQSKKRRIIRQICDGLAYLHSKKIVHCNLTTANIYLSHQSIAKIGNYGPKCIQSRLGSIADDMVSEIEESYAAPEILRHTQHLTPELLQKADIYSLGVITYEVMTGTMKHYAGIPPLDSHDDSSTLSTNLPLLVRNILKTCWEEEPKKRQTATQFLKDWKQYSSLF